MKIKYLFRNLLLLFIALIFLTDIYRMVSSQFCLTGSYHQRAINVAFRSAFGVFELIMIGIISYCIINYPLRRPRLISLLFFHVAGVLVIPMATRNFSLMALTFPWPQTLLPFDKATPFWVLITSLIIGFLIIPLITFVWGRKAWCGYVCPIGGFYSESFGRLFNPKPGRLKIIKKFAPPVWYLVMILALLTIIVFPSTLSAIRTAHKMLFFVFSQVLFFTIGIPLIGARSYCTHICPLGYEIGLIVRLKTRLKKQNGAGCVVSSLNNQ